MFRYIHEVLARYSDPNNSMSVATDLDRSGGTSNKMSVAIDLDRYGDA